MENLSVESAEKFLNQHFQLFLEKQREAGFECEIIINNDYHEAQKPYFYVQFCKDDGCKKCYKIVC